MSTESQRYHTPFVLRTGIFHSYWRTIIWWVGLSIVRYIMLLFGGIGITFLFDLPFLLSGCLILVLGTWTLRYTIAGYDELFDVFDEETENRLKLYRSFDRPPSHAQEEVRRLFKDQATYETFRGQVHRILFGKTEAVVFLLGVILTYGICVVVFLIQPTWSWFGITVYPWTYIQTLVGEFILVPLLLIFGIAGLYLAFEYILVISELGASKENLRVWEFVQQLRGERSVDTVPMSYQNFYNNASTIGQYIYRLSFRAVLTLVIGALSTLLLSITLEGGLSLDNWILSISVVPVAFLVFIMPQLRIHNLLRDVKAEVLKGLEEEHGHLKIRFMSLLKEKQQTSTITKRHIKRSKSLSQDIDFLRRVIKDTQKGGSWSFRMPTALKLLGASLIPIITALIQTILSSFLL